MYIQVKVSQETPIGMRGLVCWIPVDKRVKVGTKITLKGLGGWWKVDEMYSATKLKEKPHQDWKVGGLI